MSELDSTFEDLRTEYVLSALDRLDRMDARLLAQTGDLVDPEICHELLVQFHGLAGSGSTYGFPDVTRIGLDGERRLRAREEAGEAAPQQEVAELRALVEEARAALQEGGAGMSDLFSGAQPAAPTQLDALVVEDDPAVRALVRTRLEREGYSVRAVGSVAQAEQALQRGLPDALVVDIQLPDGSGFDLVERVRSRPQGELSAIVVASVRADFLDKVEAIHCGADGYFAKPVDWDALVARLQHLTEGHRLAPGRVLCVEDFPEQAAFVRTVLAAVGYEVRVCADPREFGAAVLEFHPDLVVMDILLPRVSGYDLTRYLRQDPRHAALPVLFLTTEGQLEARIQALKAGGDDYLVKPVAPALLLTAVAAHLERARLLRSLIGRDGLTRLLNHSGLLESLSETVERARGEQSPLTLALLDLDGLRAANERHGYAAGDQLIVELAGQLRRRLRRQDGVGRYGGGSFGLVLEGLDKSEAARLVSRLREEFAAADRRAPDGTRFRATFSAGLAALEARGDAEALRRAAADALAAAKEQGRNRVVCAQTLYS